MHSTMEIPEPKLLIWLVSMDQRLDQLFCHADLLNENLKKTAYAVRGELYMRAEELRKAGKEIIFTNGDLAPPPGMAFWAAAERHLGEMQMAATAGCVRQDTPFAPSAKRTFASRSPCQHTGKESMSTNCDVALHWVAAGSLCQVVKQDFVICSMACLIVSTCSQACHALAGQLSGP